MGGVVKHYGVVSHYLQNLAHRTRGNALKLSISLLNQPDFRPTITVKLGKKDAKKPNRPNIAHVQFPLFILETFRMERLQAKHQT